MRHLKLVLILFISLFIFNCSKSDDSDDNNDGPGIYTLVFDENTANEQRFVSDYPEFRSPCQYATILTDPVEVDGSVLQGAAISIPGGFVVDEESFTLDEFYYDGESNLYAEAIFVIDNVQFTAVSGNIEITDFSDNSNNGGEISASGIANLLITSTDGQTTRTVKATFTNVVYTYLGGC
jgi:hypothetical protein